MDLVLLKPYCSHALVTTCKKVKVNHQDFDHDHDDHHHHLDRLDAWSSSINYQSQLSGIKSFLWQLLQPHTMYFPLKLLSFSTNSSIIIIIVINIIIYFYHQYHHYHHCHQFHHIINSIIIIIVIIAIGIIFIDLHCMITPIKNVALS